MAMDAGLVPTFLQVQRYDFFLLMSATRFTENDTWLGNEISRRRRRYFYVRTKIGADMSSNRKAHPRTHSDDAVVAEIRESTVEHLRQHGSENTRVFLVDSYKPQKFDFDKLERSLIRDFPELKRSAMILSMCAYSREMITVKVTELRARIWKMAVASAAVAAVPLPGVSVVFDGYAVKTEAEFYFTQLGLDDNSLRSQAAMTRTDYAELKAIVNRSWGSTFLSIQGLKAVADLIPKGAATMVVEEFTRYIPFVGSLIASPISFGGTYYMLKYVLDKLEEVALEVVTYASEHNLAGDDDDDDDDDA